MVDWCQAKDIPIIPGVATPTEIITTLDKGFNVLKLFPADLLGGIRLIKALSPVFENVRFIPTGGITPDNIREFLESEAVWACGGSWLVASQLISTGNFEEIQRLTYEAMRIVRQVREKDN